MKKIVILIGQSASGKTTFVKKNFLGKHFARFDIPIKHCVNDRTLLLGHYGVDRRCEGTDTLSYSILPKVIEFLRKEIKNYKLLVVEGDRINNKKFFDFIALFNIPVELYVFRCSLQESIDRRVQTGSKASETFVKTTITKTEHMKTIGAKLGFKIIEIDTGNKDGQLSF